MFTDFYARPLLLPFSDQQLAVLSPIVVYWVYSLFFHVLTHLEIPWLEKYRIHDPEELKKNKVSVGQVLRGVLLQQVLQTILGFLFVEDEPVVDVIKGQLATVQLVQRVIADPVLANSLGYALYWYILPCWRFFVAMFVLDGYQYLFHRLFHTNRFLYKHIHSHHHRLYVPYAFGALYNHPVEGFIMDSAGAVLAQYISGMGNKGAMLFFAFSTLKTVDDHCGYTFPWDPLQFLFPNNVAYHDIHHQPFGIKKNYSQPFFTWWDSVLGTYVPVDVTFDRMEQKAALKKKAL
ncbi:hypothetical protein BZG36_04656 [Bifiguratus adelaidae]|uniref:Fatty acid hydroxylase domain-containing protein n=1 Tax=Bifiguratus adelaidae TaxID=1938954 RepID=A0A261Y0N6_9FUNG|nr:hypothetical protein BZG36_04656 [Bifiguratus adelaidae]